MVDRGLVDSRTKAQALILAGRILANGKPITKAGATVPVDEPIEIKPGPKYVSRGGDKLEGALIDFKIDVNQCDCLDVGSSTGGFTDCLIQNGARHVIAVDVGRAQLADSLRQHKDVTVMEKTHVLDLEDTSLIYKPQFCTIDVSFISLKRVLPKVRMLMQKEGRVLALIKPQFEVGPKNLKKGVVRDEQVRKQAVTDISHFAKELGFQDQGIRPSRLKGPKGNQEFFIYLKLP